MLPAVAVSPITNPVGFEVQVLVKSVPADTVGAVVFDVIVMLLIAVHPLVPVTVTVYVPEAVNVFAAVDGVDPPDHE